MSWVEVCDVARIPPDGGVCALVDGEQVAIFRTRDFQIFAVSNHDPFSGANVLSRGIVGSHGGRVTVASPVYKQRFDLATGECVDGPDLGIAVYEAQVRGGVVLVWSPTAAAAS